MLKNIVSVVTCFLLIIILSCEESKSPLSPNISNNRMKIAYFSNLSLDSPDIYIMNLDGSNVVNLTKSSRGEWDPQFSPDGSKIVFCSVIDGDYEIFIINSDGSNLKRLTYSPGADWDAKFSPDGDNIVFFSSRNGNFDIYVMAVDGTIQRQLTNDQLDERDPLYSPDGSKILYLTGREIYLMSNDGSDKRSVTDTMDVDPEPKFSTDGSKIIFSSEKNFPRSIYVINLDGTELKKLSEGYEPVYSPNGRTIAFTSREDNSIYSQIFIMSKDGSHITNLSNAERNDLNPIFTPDGSKIIFRSRIENSEIFIMDIDGSNKKNLTNNNLDDYGHVVSILRN